MICLSNFCSALMQWWWK